MKILQVTESFAPMWEYGGVARSSYEISSSLHKMGHDVTVYTINRNPSHGILNEEIKTTFSYPVHYFGMYRRPKFLSKVGVIPSLKSILTIRKTINDYDMIHIHDYRSILSVVVARYARRNNIPYVIHAHGALPKLGKSVLKTLFDNLFGKRMLSNAARVVALHQLEYDQFVELGVLEKNISIIPNGINLEEYITLPKSNSFREKYKIPLSDKIILFLGRVDSIKGTDILIDAFSEVLKYYTESRLVIVGPLSNEKYVDFLKSKISEYGIEKLVEFTGPLFGTDKIEAYVDSDVYVLPSRYDCFPNSVFEATACATPLIMIKESGCSGLIQNLGCGCFFNSGDAEDLAKQILNVFECYDNHKYAAQHGRNHMFELFSWERITETIYNDVYLSNRKTE